MPSENEAVWFHALDHTDYRRWIPEHQRDMVELPTSHPEIAEDRCIDLLSTLEGPVRGARDGNSQRGRGAHRSGPRAEQCSHQRRWRCTGALCLTDNSSALRRWMVAGPEVARLTEEFREQLSQRTGHKTQSIMTSQRVCRLL